MIRLHVFGAHLALVFILCFAALLSAAPARADNCGDVNETGTVTAGDALAVLKKAVGQEVALVCSGECETVDARVTELEGRLAELETLLANVSLDGNNLVVSGVNLQVVDGTGGTDGATNGLGNLIVGYNEATGGQTRSGSHNIIVGREHEYTSFGGLVAGNGNTITAAEASVLGGNANSATAAAASVSGGQGNMARKSYAAVSGGFENDANGTYSAIGGGCENTTTNSFATVSGGRLGTASGTYSSVSGGLSHTSSGTYNWRAGTLFETQ